MRITVIGCGYLGATHAACLAELGHDVLGVELDRRRRESLAAGKVPFYEPGLADLVATHVASGRLRFTDSMAEAGAFADLHFLCVGTPQRADSLGADVGFVEAAVAGLAPHLRDGALVVGRSTVPVGTAARLAAVLGPGAELAWNPEFLREGYAVRDTLAPDRIVLGVETPRAERELRAFYAPLLDAGTPAVVTDYPTAELVKMSANAFLATKISFVNTVSEVCDATGADVVALADALGHDQRIGRKFLNAGVGFGGGCLPKDIRAFAHRAGELGLDDAMAFLRRVDEINLRQRQRTVQIATRMLGGSVTSARIAVWGAAFKPFSDDVRDSPALWVAGQLYLRGARVSVYDPRAMENAAAIHPRLDFAPTALSAAHHADLVLHLTEWPEFREVDLDALGATVRRKQVVDGRNVLDLPSWRAAGWTVCGLGRR